MTWWQFIGLAVLIFGGGFLVIWGFLTGLWWLVKHYEKYGPGGW